MRRRYNLNTNRIFESESVYEIDFTFNGKPSTLEEFGVNIARFPEWKDSYASAQEAMDVAEIAMGKIADALGVDQDDVECVDDDNDWIETFTIDGEGEWVFTVYQKTNECDEAQEPLKEEYSYLDDRVTKKALLDAAKLIKIPNGIDFSKDYPAGICTHKFNKKDRRETFVAGLADGLENDPIVYIGGYTYVDPEYVHNLIDEKGYEKALYEIAEQLKRAFNVWLDGDYTTSRFESVSDRFAKLRKMFESDGDDDETKDEPTDDDETKDEPKGDEDEPTDDDETKDDPEDEDDEEMKAVILTVKKGDAEKCKEELIDANIPEEDIEIIEGDDDAENDEVRVDVNSVMELKDYLSKKGIDLEEEIGGEIVSDEEGDEGEENGDKDDNSENGEEEEDFDFSDLGDIFGAEDGEEKSESVKEGLLDFLKKKDKKGDKKEETKEPEEDEFEKRRKEIAESVKKKFNVTTYLNLPSTGRYLPFYTGRHLLFYIDVNYVDKTSAIEKYVNSNFDNLMHVSCGTAVTKK